MGTEIMKRSRETSKMNLVFIVFTLVLGLASAFPECGRRGPSSRVVGGHEAAKGEWPWMAKLVRRIPGSSSFSTCGGSILSKDWVLTASHCVKASSNPSHYTVTVGEHNVNRKDPYEVKHAVSRVIMHPKYTGGLGNYHDIALLKMASPISFDNMAVGPACLPNQGEDYEGQFCHISGWGFTMKSPNNQWDEKLQTVGSRIWKYEDCKRKWSQLNKNWHFCFGDGRVGGCMGDSGGPIQCQRKDGKYNVVGVTSFGDGKCNIVGSPAIWTRVPSYINWIKQITGLSGSGSGGSGTDNGGTGGGDGGGTGGGDGGGNGVNCIDKNSGCGKYAAKGDCRRNSRWMIPNCPKSCGLCKNCGNGNARCQEWANRGECDKNPWYMYQHCNKACKLC